MKKVFLSLVFGALTLASCSRDDNNEVTPNVTDNSKEATVDASASGTWKYFSFEKGTEVTVTDPKNDLTWDIAFQRYYIKTNSGVSGNGNGGVFKTDSKEFSALKQAPTTGYTADDKKETVQLGYPPVDTELSYNSIISGGMKSVNGYVAYDPALAAQGKSPYTVNKWVYVVKTAKGEYVKLQVVDYLDAKNKGGHPKFKYVLSSDGKF